MVNFAATAIGLFLRQSACIRLFIVELGLSAYSLCRGGIRYRAVILLDRYMPKTVAAEASQNKFC